MAETPGKTNKSAAPVLTAPTIHSLKIERFRGMNASDGLIVGIAAISKLIECCGGSTKL